jgi:hypothetical protein
MNLIILTQRKDPSTQPLIFITPDTMDGDDFEEQYPEECAPFFVTTVYADQPTVVATYQGILDMLKEGE